MIRDSVERAWADPEASAAYVAEHAAEMSAEVQARHIALYVNEFTRDLGEEGLAAARTLLTRAHRAGLTPSGAGSLGGEVVVELQAALHRGFVGPDQLGFGSAAGQ